MTGYYKYLILVAVLLSGCGRSAMVIQNHFPPPVINSPGPSAQPPDVDPCHDNRDGCKYLKGPHKP